MTLQESLDLSIDESSPVFAKVSLRTRPLSTCRALRGLEGNEGQDEVAGAKRHGLRGFPAFLLFGYSASIQDLSSANAHAHHHPHTYYTS